MKALILSVLSLFIALVMVAQPTQTIRGKVVDSESQFPLIGVHVIAHDEANNSHSTATDEAGDFRLEQVPVGRISISFSYLGYKDYSLSDVIVTSGKEVILNISLQESITDLAEIVVVARKSGEPANEMATVSAREFSVQETNRYAGSRGEPARMASNFAGVQGADDSRNDIIIRGNSPQGVLWRLEGINIPNPNHFSIPGTGGGPVTILNNKFLANSDFFTGAFPAEYGNGLAGVFDLKMRNGNNEKLEFSGQLGFLGTELMAEGPISKKSGSSFLATYRYSTLQLFQFLGINVGTDAIPQYQDGAFRLNFPFKSGANIALFGIGGASTIDIILSKDTIPDNETLIYGSNDRDQYFSSRMGVAGASYTHPINEKTFVKTTISASNSWIKAHHDFLPRYVEQGAYAYVAPFNKDNLPSILDYVFRENKYSAYFFINRKFNRKSSMKAGINADLFDLYYQDSARVMSFDINNELTVKDWKTRWNSTATPLLLQPYVQMKFKFSDDFIGTAGITSVYYSLNRNSFSPFEPRLGLSYRLANNQKLSLGLGYHSQTQSNYLYFYNPANTTSDPYNLQVGLSKSSQIVLGYDLSLKGNIRIKTETYFQYLTRIPVEKISSYFSLINAGSGFSRFFPQELKNTGTGRNYGLELTIEKYFSNQYYFLITGSLFDSKYKGSNGVAANTTFNGNYALNGLFAKEWKFVRSSLNAGGKITFAGGRRYGDVDVTASREEGEIIYLNNSNYNLYAFRPYFRVDGKINYRFNRNRVAHEIAVDLVNLFNIKNILTLTYDPDSPDTNYTREEYQLGFLPLFYYRVDF